MGKKKKQKEIRQAREESAKEAGRVSGERDRFAAITGHTGGTCQHFTPPFPPADDSAGKVNEAMRISLCVLTLCLLYPYLITQIE